MMKRKAVAAAFNSERILLTQSFWRALIAMLILFVFVLGIIFLGQYHHSEDKTDDAVLRAKYIEERDKAIYALAVFNGEIEQEGPGNIVFYPGFEESATLKIEQCDLYLNTGTTENDYLEISYEKEVVFFTIAEKKGAAVGMNIGYVCGFALVAVAIICGFAVSANMIGKKSSMNLLGQVNRENVFLGKTAFYGFLLVVLAVIIALCGIIFISLGEVTEAYFVLNGSIHTPSVYGLFFSQWLFFLVIAGLFYFLTILLTLAFRNRPVLGMITALAVFLSGIGLCVASNELFTSQENLALRAMPIFGMVFNAYGFADFTIYYSLPLGILAAAFLYIKSMRRFKQMQF